MTMKEQITAGKGQLRHRIKELEEELTALKNAPIKRMAERLQRNNELLTQRVIAVEKEASIMIAAAINMAQTLNAPFPSSENGQG